MSPANIEAKLKAASPLIGQAIAIGDGKPYNVALIVLDPDVAPAWASSTARGQREALLAGGASAAIDGRQREAGARRADQEVHDPRRATGSPAARS